VAIALATIALAIAAARRWNQTPLEAAALAALASLAAHDFVDFSLELPVVAMTTILLNAILFPVRLDDGKRPRRHTPWVRGALLTLAAATCATAATPLGQLAHPAAAQLAAVAEPSERLALAIDAVDHHPADYLLMGRAAQTLMDLGDPRALAVISRALVLDPQHAGLHRLAATMLLRAKQPAQAQVELALAVQFAPYTMLQELVDEIAATFPDAEDAARAFPFEPSAFPRLQNFIIPHKDLAFAYSRRLAYLNPSDFSAQLLYAHAALTIGRADLALPAARGAFALRATTESAIALATARARNSDTAGSIVMLRESLARGIATTPGERVQLLSSIADLELASGSLGPAAATLDELAQLVTDQGERVALHLRRADLHDRRSEPNLAKWERAQATKLQAGGL
jgi:tetratricopeptide (TPR) repeat protein